MIEVNNVSYSVKHSTLVKDVSLRTTPGEFAVIMGANGAGKSTLLKMIAGSLQPSKGEILFDGKKLRTFSTADLAKKRAVLSQHYQLDFPVTAREIVMMGRYCYFQSQPHRRDEELVDECLQRMDATILANRNYQTLSGGEAQKVQMSRVLAQIGDTSATEQKLLLLDEPVSNLDPRYQHQLLQAAKELCSRHVTVIAVLHDINLALKFGDRICFMKSGAMETILTNPNEISAEVLKKIFDVDATVIDAGTQRRVLY
jgi:iron complex transport system ATP-binding protein